MWLIIIKLHCTLSSKLLGQYYWQVKEGKKKEKEKKKRTNKQINKGVFEILHGLFPSSRCTLRDLFS